MKLPLNRPLLSQPPANSLPLLLARKLGEQAHEADQAPNLASPKAKRTMNGVGMTLTVASLPAGSISNGKAVKRLGQTTATALPIKRQMLVNITKGHLARQQAFYPLANDVSARYGSHVLINNKFIHHWLPFINVHDGTKTAISDGIGLASWLIQPKAKVVGLNQSQSQELQVSLGLSDGVVNTQDGKLIANQHKAHTQHAINVPCRYYPIPKPPPPPAVFACRLRPPASGLPLTLTRRKGLPASALPLPLMCWHDVAPAFVPNLRSYLVHHIITATLGGLNIDPIKFDIKTDMDSYCWSGNIEISHVDYQRIKAKLDVERGNEPLILVNVNGNAFGFIAENVSRKRQFGASVYQLSGRSSTARLGQDYAHSQGLNGTAGTIEQDLYASQIMRMQLNDLPFSIDEFDVDDWLIPAGTLNVSNQTPISIISQLATACGGKVISHISEPKLSIIKRWRVPAWEMATAKPSLVVPMNVVLSISDEKRTNPRYNTVTLIGQKQAFEIYRQGQGRDLIAPVANWYLYTDQASAIARGVQLLSDSGNHVHYTVKMLVSDKHNLPLAKLGQIWQINDDTDGGDGAFNALITSVALSVSRDNDAVVVWQTVGMDRYVDV